MTGIPSLVIGIASSSAERRQLAQLLGGTESFLIVSSANQARRFLDLVRRPPAPLAPAGDAEPAAPTPGLELAVDSDRRVLRWREREVGLTPLEHDLFVCLAGTPGQVWTYARLHRAVWGNDHLGRGSDMHSVVRRIRHKLGRLGAPATIHAVRGVGFRLTPS
ncbi:Transcriptional regulatory protein, C terminal [Micromonospora sediminicola]|uniref:Transcriptional regulatory protein, C terminal n=1 Tax=Micromonospora sediminicola TaxID=946078 RepID=A0A1A9BFJ7_9ACTN|nr:MULTISPECIES: winged helix-turn-helix domain-containing protein [Micromonospora]PGH45794.1 winged helix family transcriptional regulator [Micromonospora sp. WMMA1996]SBT67734.1 Transcriptional regulatory protein, C terminal [Micromonospora sediminicola]